MTDFTSTSIPLVGSDLDVVEKRFGFKFPKELRDFYLRFNGGRPNADRFVDEKGTCIVDTFLPIKRSSIPTLSTMEQSVQRVKFDQSLLPVHLVQFGIDPFGNYYCFSTKTDDFGAIYYFRMDGNPARNAELLSSSLTDFLRKLTSDEHAKGGN